MEHNDIQFDEPEYRIPRRRIQRNLFVDFLLNNKIAKDTQQATYILLGFVIIVGILIIFIFIKSNSNSSQEEIRLQIDKAIKATDAPK